MTLWNPKLENYQGPRYKALAEAIADDIKAGLLKPEQKLPTHRSLAELLGVTVGTVTRGYAEAEKRELVVGRMGSGTFVGGKKNGMSDYLSSLKEQEGQIDMSLSITLSHGQDIDLAEILSELGQAPVTIHALINYQYQAGTVRHRTVIANWLHKFGIEADNERLVICNGGQNAIHTILMALTRAGDRVVSDSLTYPGFTHLARQHCLRHFGIEMDESGMIPSSLEEACQKHQPKLLYCMPNLQNPTSSTLSESRRQEIIELARRYDFYIIEDQVQGIFESDPPPPLFAKDPDRVFFTGSFSKVFAGGLRIGFIIAPLHLLNSTISSLYLDCLFAPPLMAEIVCHAIETGRLDRMLQAKRSEIAARQTLVDSIFAGFEYRSSPECPHTWLILPEPWQADGFVLELQKNGVLVKATNSFTSITPPQVNGIRICLTGPQQRDQVQKGLQIIRDTMDRHPGVWQSIM
jgi:DNA-binding transcriptional MocR family regulator